MIARKVYDITGYQFSNTGLLQQALTHRSYSRSANNERLEFLGDSILNLIISNFIYHRFVAASEGELSRIRAALVKQETLARIARDVGLGEHINLGGGELKSGGFRRASILSDALEALIGAIYLDADFDHAEQAVLRLYGQRLQRLDMETTLKDPKTRLQEYLQSRQLELPVYLVTQTTGKSHDQVFTVTCQLEDLGFETKGRGSSRKKAEQQAAETMLDKLDL